MPDQSVLEYLIYIYNLLTELPKDIKNVNTLLIKFKLGLKEEAKRILKSILSVLTLTMTVENMATFIANQETRLLKD